MKILFWNIDKPPILSRSNTDPCLDDDGNDIGVREAIARIIDFEKPDIIVFAECGVHFSAPWLGFRLSKYPHVGNSFSGKAYGGRRVQGLVWFSRAPLTMTTKNVRMLTCNVAGDEFCFVHMVDGPRPGGFKGHPGFKFYCDDLLAQKPAVFIGDFNATSGDPPVIDLRASGYHELTDTPPTPFTFSAYGGGTVGTHIDKALALDESRWTLRYIPNMDFLISDHLGMILEG